MEVVGNMLKNQLIMNLIISVSSCLQYNMLKFSVWMASLSAFSCNLGISPLGRPSGVELKRTNSNVKLQYVNNGVCSQKDDDDVLVGSVVRATDDPCEP